MAHDAFISYAFEDRDVAGTLCDKLEAAGIRCWIAPRDARPGLPYGAQIVQAIAQSRIEVLLFSRYANESRAVLGEVELGANREKSILPVRVENVEPADALEYYIRAVQWFDATRPPLDARLSEVVGIARDVLGGVPQPVTPAPETKGNLPAQVTSFVGRDAEIAEVAGLIGEARLVTLTGSAGVGKTRASLQVAASVRDQFKDGAWFIELAPLANGDYVPSAVAQALGLNVAPAGEATAQLARALKAERRLLVFDNCEHLTEAAGRLITQLLRDCPNVNVIASSRQALGIAGERLYALPALANPSRRESARITRFDAARFPAIALFVERAIAVARDFTLTDENAPFVAEVCRRLDGIPLAIELAAARVRVLAPRQLRDQLDERFRLLTGGRRDALPRQRTLRALIDWSYDLLDEPERRLFRRLGTFVDGFSLEGALAVGAGDGLETDALLDLLESLVDKSLVLAEPDGDALRYRLLESTRLYAREKLAAAGESDASSSRHLHYLRDRFSAIRERHETTARIGEMTAALATELEDVRAALDWALRSPEGRTGAELMFAIGAMWGTVGLYAEALGRIEGFLAALSGTDPRTLARLWIGISGLASNSAHTARAFEAAEKAIRYARECGDPAALADALRAYAWNAARLRKFEEAEKALREAEAIPAPSARFRLVLLDARAIVSSQRGDLPAAAAAYADLRDAYRALGNSLMERATAANLAELEHARGQTRRSIEIVRELLPGFRDDGDQTSYVQALSNLAGYLAAVDDLPAARAAAQESIRELAPREPDSAFVAGAIEHVALTLALGNDSERAAKLAAYVDAAYGKLGFQREFTERTTHERLMRVLRERFSQEELETMSAKGSDFTPAEAIAEALR